MDLTSLIDDLAALPDDQVVKAVLDAAARKQLSDSDFAYIDTHGKRHLPIHDAEHVRAALSRFNQTHFESDGAKSKAKARIDAAAKRFGITVNKAEDASPAGVFVQITKADELEGVIYGVANQANLVDRQGDVVKPAELRKAAHDFLADYNGNFNVNHGDDALAGKLVESWIDGDNWCIAFRPDDRQIAIDAAAGEFIGFSIEGGADRVQVTE